MNFKILGSIAGLLLFLGLGFYQINRYHNIEGDWVVPHRGHLPDDDTFYRFRDGRILLVGRTKDGVVVLETGQYDHISNGWWSIQNYGPLRDNSNRVFVTWKSLSYGASRRLSPPDLRRSIAWRRHGKMIDSATVWKTNDWQ